MSDDQIENVLTIKELLTGQMILVLFARLIFDRIRIETPGGGGYGAADKS